MFDIPDEFGIDDTSLSEALRFRGGSGELGAARILLRAAVASLLNASNPDVDFQYTEAEIIAQVNNALSGTRSDMLTLAEELDNANNEGCPLN